MNAERFANKAEARKVAIKVLEELIRSRIEPNKPMKNRLLNKCSKLEWPKIEVKNFQKGEVEALKPGSKPVITCPR